MIGAEAAGIGLGCGARDVGMWKMWKAREWLALIDNVEISGKSSARTFTFAYRNVIHKRAKHTSERNTPFLTKIRKLNLYISTYVR